MLEEMSEKRKHPNDPLHGIILEKMLTELVDFYGWDDMACRVRIHCFAKDPEYQIEPKVS